jgi:bifunctional DNA-binding transcriptional regulator/antitoxin component of YhaV-PrlF toxin-antitoxin module
VYEHGHNCASLGVVIPHKFLEEMKITKGDYVKIYPEQSKIWIQKLEDNGESKSEQAK